MKTYPYQDGDKLIQLVEKRELDQLRAANAELLDRLADARESHLHASARGVQTIQRQAILLERLAGALKEIAWIKETGHRDYSWTGDTAFAAFSAYESANFEPVARLIAAAPDLLDALEAIMGSDVFEWNGSAAFWLQDKVKAAIAKAKGEQL